MAKPIAGRRPAKPRPPSRAVLSEDFEHIARRLPALGPPAPPRRRRGRPPAGGKGRRVSEDFLQTTLRLPPESKAVLDALTRLLAKKQREIMADALALYVRRLPATDRELLARLMARKPLVTNLLSRKS